MAITVEHDQLKRCDVFRVSGRIDSEAAPSLEKEVRQVMDAGRHRLVLNLAGVDYMSSAALRVLINTSKECRRSRGDVRLAMLNERVAQVLDLAGLTELFQVFDSESKAVGSF
jgi:anti-sigma B factor antagonist